jgi:hypothetical protein
VEGLVLQHRLLDVGDMVFTTVPQQFLRVVDGHEALWTLKIRQWLKATLLLDLF